MLTELSPILLKDNAMAKEEKRTKGKIMIYKTLHRELKIEQDKPHRLKISNGMLYREWIDVTGIKNKNRECG
jgi:hypothetical protein